MKNLFSPSFTCPICNYRGPFQTARPDHVLKRRHAYCPNCKSIERQRVQWQIFHELAAIHSFKDKKLLHFAPEPIFHSVFRKLFAQVTTTDLVMPDVDVRADICQLPFPDGSYDVVFASHVLGLIQNDRQAMSEVRRVLSLKGLAIIEVPITSVKTIEYDKPNPLAHGNVRAPGLDYYDKFADLFEHLKKITSEDVSSKYQPFIYCDWTGFPTPESPLREPIPGKRHPIIVAVYYV